MNDITTLQFLANHNLTRSIKAFERGEAEDALMYVKELQNITAQLIEQLDYRVKNGEPADKGTSKEDAKPL